MTAAMPESSSAFTVTVTVPRNGEAGAEIATGVGAVLSICTSSTALAVLLAARSSATARKS